MTNATTLTVAQQQQLVSDLALIRAENERLKANAVSKPMGLGMKVSTKGAVSVYGLGRWPVTLYSTQWTELLTKADAIKAFIQQNQAVLSTKP